jgi:hypothetical protein
VVVVMTRWQEADLAGRLLAASSDGGDPVIETRFPALAEENDRLGREPGEALWPARYDAGYIEHSREVMGPYWFSAMYQGRPTPEGGGIFDRTDFRNFDVDGEEVVFRNPAGNDKRFGVSYCNKFQVVDLAASEKETADYTVMSEIWVTPENDMLVNAVVRDRVAVPDQPAFFKRHHAGCRVKFEVIGYQTGIVQTMLREGFPAESVHPTRTR